MSCRRHTNYHRSILISFKMCKTAQLMFPQQKKIRKGGGNCSASHAPCFLEEKWRKRSAEWKCASEPTQRPEPAFHLLAPSMRAEKKGCVSVCSSMGACLWLHTGARGSALNRNGPKGRRSSRKKQRDINTLNVLNERKQHFVSFSCVVLLQVCRSKVFIFFH